MAKRLISPERVVSKRLGCTDGRGIQGILCMFSLGVQALQYFALKGSTIRVWEKPQ